MVDTSKASVARSGVGLITSFSLHDERVGNILHIGIGWVCAAAERAMKTTANKLVLGMEELSRVPVAVDLQFARQALGE